MWSDYFSSKIGEITFDDGFDYYDVIGNLLFPVYGSHGGLSSVMVSYIFKKEYDINANRFRWIGSCMAFTMAEIHAAVEVGKQDELVRKKREDALKNLSEFDGDGGNLPPIRWKSLAA